MSSSVQPWVGAMRPRTLPLALSSIAMGSFLAAAIGQFRWEVFALCALTTIFLQILSNLANDYGDSVHGADHAERQGPQRAVQSGQISSKSMFRAIVLFSVLSLVSGVALLFIALGKDALYTLLFFLVLGLLAIAAAITYTAGKKPYGYAGLGDISVFLFFGVVGVLGTYYLHTQAFFNSLLLPAASCGFFSAAVLNVNNIRDIESDLKAGKRSVPVRLGRAAAVKYHWFLLIAGLGCAIVYVVLNYHNPFQFAFLGAVPLLIKNGKAVSSLQNPRDLDPYLKQMALTTLLFVIAFGVGNLVEL